MGDYKPSVGNVDSHLLSSPSVGHLHVDTVSVRDDSFSLDDDDGDIKSHHHLGPPITCDHLDPLDGKPCGLSFSSVRKLHKHQKAHETVFCCTKRLCHINFDTKEQLKQHIAEAHSLKCAHCDAVFDYPSKLKDHEIRHQPVKSYSCPVSDCRKIFMREKTLIQHQRQVHLMKIPYARRQPSSDPLKLENKQTNIVHKNEKKRGAKDMKDSSDVDVERTARKKLKEYDIPPKSQADRAAGAIVGALIGDALGVGPHGYYNLEQLRQEFGDWIHDYTACRPGRANDGIPAGESSRSGQVVRLLLESLSSKGRYCAEDFTSRVEKLIESFDAENQLLTESPKKGVPWGTTNSMVDAPDAALRIVVIAARYLRDPFKAVWVATENIRLTHTNEVAVQQGAAFASVLVALMRGEPLDEHLSWKLCEMAKRAELPFAPSTVVEEPESSSPALVPVLSLHSPHSQPPPPSVRPPASVLQSTHRPHSQHLGPAAAVASPSPAHYLPCPDLLLQASWCAQSARDTGVHMEPASRVAQVYGLASSLQMLLPAAFYLCARFPDDFETAVLSALNGGGDNMARAGLTGALSGAMVGLSGIPDRFIKGLLGSKRIVKNARLVGAASQGLVEEFEAQLSAEQQRESEACVVRAGAGTSSATTASHGVAVGGGVSDALVAHHHGVPSLNVLPVHPRGHATQAVPTLRGVSLSQPQFHHHAHAHAHVHQTVHMPPVPQPPTIAHLTLSPLPHPPHLVSHLPPHPQQQQQHAHTHAHHGSAPAHHLTHAVTPLAPPPQQPLGHHHHHAHAHAPHHHDSTLRAHPPSASVSVGLHQPHHPQPPPPLHTPVPPPPHALHSLVVHAPMVHVQSDSPSSSSSTLAPAPSTHTGPPAPTTPNPAAAAAANPPPASAGSATSAPAGPSPTPAVPTVRALSHHHSAAPTPVAATREDHMDASRLGDKDATAAAPAPSLLPVGVPEVPPTPTAAAAPAATPTVPVGAVAGVDTTVKSPPPPALPTLPALPPPTHTPAPPPPPTPTPPPDTSCAPPPPHPT